MFVGGYVIEVNITNAADCQAVAHPEGFLRRVVVSSW